MRDGLSAPTEAVSPTELAQIRAFLDGQSRIDLAVWVRHEQRGVDGPLYDHHLILGIEDEEFVACDLRALEVGIEVPQPGWLDLFPLSEVEALRPFAAVLWERGDRAREGDPLDYRLTWEPFRFDGAIAAAFEDGVRAVGGVTRIEATVQRLWKDGTEIGQSENLFVEFAERRPTDFEQIQRLARDAGLVSWGMSAGLPNDPRVRTATLYEAKVR